MISLRFWPWRSCEISCQAQRVFFQSMACYAVPVGGPCEGRHMIKRATDVTDSSPDSMMSRDIIHSLLEGCNKRKDPAALRQLHFFMISSGLESISLYGDHLIRSFASCGCLPEACQAFLKILKPSAYTWNAIIWAHAELSEGEKALVLYYEMQQKGVKADRVTFLCILKVCGSIGALAQGKLIHMTIIEDIYDLDVVIGSSLIHMYGRCASLEEACKVFNNLPNPNVVSWGALIAGYAQYGGGLQALQLFENMQQQGFGPEKATFLCALKACGSIGATIQGQLIHDQIIRNGFQIDVVIASTLVDMYCKCGRLLESCKLFKDLPNRDVVSWAALISGYVQHGHAFSAFELLEKMQQEGIMPDKVMFLCILRACSDIAGEQCRVIHDCIIRAGFESNMDVANSLVDMYAKCGSLQEAHKIFNEVESRNVVSCSAMIFGYAQEGHGFPAFAIFEEMQDEGIKPDKVTLLGLLKACGTMGAIRKGRLIHMNLIEIGLDADVTLGNTLVDMYAKCGSLEEAFKVFDMLQNRDMVSWRAIISGYAQQGNCMLAEVFVKDMQRQGLRPDDAIYMSILAGCSYAGLLKEGHFYFMSMRQNHGIPPTIEHYNCMVDLLGRVGHLIEAEDLLQTMPVLPNLIGWSTLLSGCKTHGNTELGRRCFSELFQLDSRDASCYMIMSSIYSNIQMWEVANKLQKIRKYKGAWKKPGEAWVEVGTKIHEFVVGGQGYAQDDFILAKSNRIGLLMKKHGHVPEVDTVYELMLSEQQEEVSFKQLEKLATCAASS